MRSTKLLTILALIVAMVGCATARNEAKGFRLAGNGDPQRGKAAFLEFGCNGCHEVRGASLPSPTIQRIVLGGSVLVEPSDGYMVTAIINPAYHSARYPAAKDSAGTHPAMPEYTGRMTVQQLTDIVAYLKSRYALAPATVPIEVP